VRFLRFIAIKLIAVIWLAPACMLICALDPARAEKRVALVIGNSAYTNISPLRNPARDARLIADTLRGLGFTLTGGGALIDLDKAGIDRAVQSFGAQLAAADVALFYYAGGWRAPCARNPGSPSPHGATLRCAHSTPVAESRIAGRGRPSIRATRSLQCLKIRHRFCGSTEMQFHGMLIIIKTWD
jgi:uncharacterized caspase-like protein